ncbi:aromatic amino acid transport family protein [Vibrio brasiliensis]|uniref:aromatic amino acid transport family protein n=1 Tax=Vibrio brasiliensis TaxID=170652 RepID=UPI0030B8E60B
MSAEPIHLALFPIAVASFGYHHALSSMRDYYRNERMAQYSLIGGTSIAFLCYAIWLVCVYYNLPQSAFHAVSEQGGNSDALLEAVNLFIPHRYTTLFIIDRRFVVKLHRCGFRGI